MSSLFSLNSLLESKLNQTKKSNLPWKKLNKGNIDKKRQVNPLLKLDELSVLECLLHIGLVQHCVVPPREAPEALHILVALGIKGQEGGEEGQIGQGEPLPHQESVVPEEAVEPLQLLAGRGCGACNNNTASKKKKKKKTNIVTTYQIE